MPKCPLFHSPYLLLVIPALFFVFRAVPTHAAPPGQASHYSGYKQQLSNGTMACEGFSTNLTSQDYQAVIKYKGDSSCCGAQTDGDGVWIGGNNATQFGLDFIRNLNRLQFKDLGLTQITTTLDGTWHTYIVTKTGTTATMTLDGNIIKTDTAAPTAPDILAIGGSCTAPNNFNNWNNFWYDVTFYNQNVCTANTTTADVATNSNSNDFRKNYGDILPGQTTAYIRGYNTAGILRSLREVPNGWSVNSPLNNFPNSVDIFGWKVGLHTVTAIGGGENYCSTSGTATFNCINLPPSITPNAPKGVVSSIPATFSWTANDTSYTDFGMDSCGGNFNPNDDSLAISLFDGSGCNTPLAKVCNNISGFDASKKNNSCDTTYPFIQSHTYSWLITAQNGPMAQNKSTSTCLDFTYQPSAAAWWQTDSGHVYASSGIKSLIPCTGPTCKFSLASFGAPGVVAHNTGSADFNGGGNLSQTGWLVGGSPYLPSMSLFDELYRQVPVTLISISSTIDQITFNSLTATPPTADAYYMEYSGGGSLNLSSLNIGDKKVVIYSKSAAEVDLTGNISVNHGKGFFGLITTAPVRVSPNVTSLDTLIFTELSFSTGFNGSGLVNDKPLVVNGMIISKGTIQLERDLDRTKTSGKNSLGPAEKFIFAPDYLFTMPRGLRRFRFQLNEVSPTQ